MPPPNNWLQIACTKREREGEAHHPFEVQVAGVLHPKLAMGIAGPWLLTLTPSPALMRLLSCDSTCESQSQMCPPAVYGGMKGWRLRE